MPDKLTKKEIKEAIAEQKKKDPRTVGEKILDLLEKLNKK